MAFDFPASPIVGQQFTAAAGTIYVWNGYAWVLASSVPVTAGAAIPQGRLTLQTGTPVMTTTQSAKTTIYFSPYVGNLCPIYDGANFSMSAFSELSVLTTDTTKSPAAIGVSKCNDWFVWNDAGTLRLGHGPDWTNDTTRSAGTALTMVNGIWLNNAVITNGPAASRGTYVGTTRSNASSQLDWIYGAVASGGTAGFLGIWNAYNRRQVTSRSSDSTDNWSYASAVWRPSNNSTTMRCSFVIGLVEDAFSALFGQRIIGTSAGVSYNGIALNSITVPLAGGTAFVGVSLDGWVVSNYSNFPSLGFNFVQAMEAGQNGGGSQWSGDDAVPGFRDNGLVFTGWV